MSFLNKIYQKARKFYLRLKFEKIVTVAVLITQALKRFVQSDLANFLSDLIPIPWLSLSQKILAGILKAHDLVQPVAKKILLLHEYIAEDEDGDMVNILIGILRTKTKEEQRIFWQEFCDALIDVQADGDISPEERAELREEFYQKLLKS